MKHSRIEVNIDKLVLRGLDQCDPHRIKEAVERELTSSIRNEGLPSSFSQDSEIETIDGGSVQIGTGETENALGSHIAQKLLGSQRR